MVNNNHHGATTAAIGSDYRRTTLFQQIHEKRAMIMESVENHLLNSYDGSDDDDLRNTCMSFSPSEQKLRKSFFEILERQRMLRNEVNSITEQLDEESFHTMKQHMVMVLRRMTETFHGWHDNRVAELLSLLSDLFRQIQPMFGRQSVVMKDAGGGGDDDVDDDDDEEEAMAMLALSASTADAQHDFTLLSDVYTTVLQLLL